MSKLVSIVVPAYNAAKRIEATLLSIAAQDYENIEIIVVNDGSSDGTGSLARNVLRRSGRDFRVIEHESNMGRSAARNSGFGSARGDYVVFFDADDLADSNFVSVLLEAITKNDCDAAFCGFRIRFESTGQESMRYIKLNSSRKYTAEELTIMYIFTRIKPSICTTVFKTSFIKTAGLEFTAGCGYGEDVEFLVKVFSRCRSINFSTGCHYIYVQHEDMTSRTARRYADNAEATCRAARYLMERTESPKVRDIAMNFMLADGLIKTLNVAARQGDQGKFYRILHLPETRRVLAASLSKSVRRKLDIFVKAAVLLLFPRLYFRMRSRS
jgi:glycosyltransferase involved in cell wall biosynthesis